MGYYPQESLYKPYKYHGYTVRGTPVLVPWLTSTGDHIYGGFADVFSSWVSKTTPWPWVQSWWLVQKAPHRLLDERQSEGTNKKTESKAIVTIVGLKRSMNISIEKHPGPRTHQFRQFFLNQLKGCFCWPWIIDYHPAVENHTKHPAFLLWLPPKLAASLHLKTDGWNTFSFPFGDGLYFRAFAVSFREGNGDLPS